MASTHLHSPSAALDAFAILDGVKFSSGTNSFRIAAMTLGAMLSLSYDLSVGSSVPLPSRRTAGCHQSSILAPGLSGSGFLSGLVSSMTSTAFMASCTPAGGLLIDLTRSMSAFLMVSRARSASLRMGMASARSASHSSLTFFTSAACAAVASSSFIATAFCASTSGTLLSTCSVSAAVSFCACTSPGCKSSSSCFIVFTLLSAIASASSPPRYRFFRRFTSSRLIVSSVLYVLMSSRYDVGVT
mmetsp:Transcript_66852/g.164810  ORF Transcript_66852/g.164810 Transcript_66852/m.164810 type:complete len:244 (+) Transcript_66852:1288-2019(+)